jgi:hypothetical protein
MSFASIINNEPLDRWGRNGATNNYWERKAQKSNGLTGVTNQYGVDTGSKTYAGDTYAALTRGQWQQYVSTFVPIENQLIDYATSPDTVNNAMAEASKDVNASFDAQSGATGRRLRGLGVNLTPEQQGVQQRSMGLSRSLADVGAQNTAAELTRSRQQQILGNPSPQGGQPLMAGGG